MKTALKIICLLGVLLVVAVAVIYVLLGGPQSLRLRQQFDNLVRTNNHEAMARAAIAAIQTTKYQTIFTADGLTNLPPLIAQMKPQSVAVSPEDMKIEFHGGFDHFGFEIQAQEDFWELTWYTERKSHPLLKIRKTESGGEQGGPVNGGQPIRSDTNRTSSVAGSRR